MKLDSIAQWKKLRKRFRIDEMEDYGEIDSDPGTVAFRDVFRFEDGTQDVLLLVLPRSSPAMHQYSGLFHLRWKARIEFLEGREKRLAASK